MPNDPQTTADWSVVPPRERRAVMRGMRHIGLTYREIALRFRVSAERVRQIVHPGDFMRNVKEANHG